MDDTNDATLLIGSYAITPPLTWEEIEDGKEYAVIDTTDAGDWCVKLEKFNKDNGYFWTLVQSARVFENTVEAGEFIEALTALGGKHGR